MKSVRSFICAAGTALGLVSSPALSADAIQSGINLVDPTPVSEQKPAVDGVNFQLGVVSGKIGGYANHMLLASMSAPMPFLSNFGLQLDLGLGDYRSGYTSAASGLHIFYRDPSTGMLGVYGDWAYVDNEHGGRVGVEGSLYNGRWTVDAVVGVRFGQHYLTEVFDEVDLSYYFTDNFRGSVGHRGTSRGHVANIGFEFMPQNVAGWSIYGEAEAGEDSYYGAWMGVKYAFGTSGATSLIERDREAGVKVRIPRNIASVTRCGTIANPADYFTSWNGFKDRKSDHLCGSDADLDDHNAVETKKN